MRVYVAGPFTGAETRNTQNAIKTAENIRALGFSVFIPHLYMLWDLHSPHGYEYWMEMCLDEVRRSDILYRIAISPGASREEALMKELGRPVVYDLASLSQYKMGL